MGPDRRARLAALLGAASLSVAACDPQEERPCAISDERCSDNTVQYCLGPIDGGSWVNDHTCTGTTHCAVQGGCSDGHKACCVQNP